MINHNLDLKKILNAEPNSGIYKIYDKDDEDIEFLFHTLIDNGFELDIEHKYIILEDLYLFSDKKTKVFYFLDYILPGVKYYPCYQITFIVNDLDDIKLNLTKEHIKYSILRGYTLLSKKSIISTIIDNRYDSSFFTEKDQIENIDDVVEIIMYDHHSRIDIISSIDKAYKATPLEIAKLYAWKYDYSEGNDIYLDIDILDISKYILEESDNNSAISLLEGEEDYYYYDYANDSARYEFEYIADHKELTNLVLKILKNKFNGWSDLSELLKEFDIYFSEESDFELNSDIFFKFIKDQFLDLYDEIYDRIRDSIEVSLLDNIYNTILSEIYSFLENRYIIFKNGKDQYRIKFEGEWMFNLEEELEKLTESDLIGLSLEELFYSNLNSLEVKRFRLDWDWDYHIDYKLFYSELIDDLTRFYLK